MIRCKKCLIPSTRPDTEFIDGVCSACIAYENRPSINWTAKKKEMEHILEHGKNDTGYDCIVPSSGGKDSHWQTLTLIEMGAKPLVVTASTCHLTALGRKNIDNLARYATTIEVTPNREVRAKLNRLGLELVGDISWPEHASIFTTPFRVACDLGIPLIFYGENPQNQYGGPMGATNAQEMTQRWVSEFGGFLGLRPSDFIGMDGITERDMQDYMPPKLEKIIKQGIQAHFLGQYLGWDSDRNSRVAKEHGFECSLPALGNYWPCENLDNAQTGIHDHMMYRKYGYGRFVAQISVDIRKGNIHRHEAIKLLNRDGLLPESYGGVYLTDMLCNIGMTREELFKIMDQFTNWDLFDGEDHHKPILRELCLQRA